MRIYRIEVFQQPWMVKSHLTFLHLSISQGQPQIRKEVLITITRWFTYSGKIHLLLNVWCSMGKRVHSFWSKNYWSL